jgi:hypothetical protein
MGMPYGTDAVRGMATQVEFIGEYPRSMPMTHHSTQLESNCTPSALGGANSKLGTHWLENVYSLRTTVRTGIPIREPTKTIRWVREGMTLICVGAHLHMQQPQTQWFGLVCIYRYISI